jgi:hypothetical protein
MIRAPERHAIRPKKRLIHGCPDIKTSSFLNSNSVVPPVYNSGTMSLFQNPVGANLRFDETGSWRKLLIPCYIKNYTNAIFFESKKLFQKQKFWNSLK